MVTTLPFDEPVESDGLNLQTEGYADLLQGKMEVMKRCPCQSDEDTEASRVRETRYASCDANSSIMRRSSAFLLNLSAEASCAGGPCSLILASTSNMPPPEDASTSTTVTRSFEELGVIRPLLGALEQMDFKRPTEIQAEVLPHALEGRDIIGVAETGSGKTAAFGLPILQKLWEEPKGLFACVLAPTRELAFQISQQFESLGSAIGVRCAVIVGGMNMVDQAVALAKKPHIVVATPGRLNDHLENTKGFSLRGIKFLVSPMCARTTSNAHKSASGHGRS